MPDNTNPALQPPALSQEHDAVVSIPRERGNVRCAAADRGSPTSLPPSSMTRDGRVVGMQYRSHGSSTNMTDSNGQPELLPAAHHQQPRSLDLGDSISKPVDSGPLVQSPLWPQHLPSGPQSSGTLRGKLTPILTLNLSSRLPSGGLLSSPLLFAFSLFSFASFLPRHWIYSLSVYTCRVGG